MPNITAPKPPVLKPKPAHPNDVTIVEQPAPDALFKAIGIIRGEVSFDEEDKAWVKIGSKSYRLGYSGISKGKNIHRLGHYPKNKDAFQALRKDIKNSGTSTKRLIVYPQIVHFAEQKRPHELSFNLVSFTSEKAESNELTNGLANKLNDFEFELCGLWQFIPASSTPVITIFKNLNKARLSFIKTLSPAEKVKALKGMHIPLMWRNSLVKPFRFNSKLDRQSQQGQAPFIQVTARFLPETDSFEFIQLQSPPSASAPRFLRASAKDKAAAMKKIK